MNNNSFSNGVIWITGYSAAGKTTMSKQVELELAKRNYRTIYLDGDDLRAIFGNNQKFDKNSRIELGSIYFRLCNHLSSQGYIVIISAIAMFDDILLWIRENIPNSIQIYLKVSNDERRLRDAQTKKIFVDTNMTKNDNLYDEPRNADLVIENHNESDVLLSAIKISDFFVENVLNKST
jgi:bifunctional enzyme CysN/CysC